MLMQGEIKDEQTLRKFENTVLGRYNNFSYLNIEKEKLVNIIHIHCTYYAFIK